MTSMGLRIKELRERDGLSQAAFARKWNVSREMVGQWERDESAPKHARQKEIADHYDVSLDWLAGQSSTVDIHTPAHSQRTVARTNQTGLPSQPREKRSSEYEALTDLVYVIGKVQAGAWMEETYQLPRAEWEEMPQPADPRYPGVQRYALRNVGESMNKKCPDGGIWVFVRFMDLAGQGPSPGNFVIVERHRDGFVEATCKEFRLDENGKPCLYPCSEDPSFKPIPFDAGDPEYNQIQVIGRVTDILSRV